MSLEMVVYGFLMLGAVYLGGIIFAPLLDKWWNKARDISGDHLNVHQVKEMLKDKNRIDQHSREGGKFSDTRLDGLLAANQIDEARLMAEEKLRRAHEQGNETLQALYKGYLLRMKDN